MDVVLNKTFVLLMIPLYYLASICLSGASEMRVLKVIRDPKAFQLVADSTRRRMIYLLRAKEMTVSQLAEELGKTPQAIYHHIRKLKEADMVEVAREERIDHFIETYYQATAEVFQFSLGEGEGSRQYAEKQAKEALQSLPQLGLEVRIDDKTVSRLVALERRMDAIGHRPELQERALELKNLGFLTRQDVAKYSRLLAMRDAEFEEYLDLQRQFRDLLQSRLAGPVKTEG